MLPRALKNSYDSARGQDDNGAGKTEKRFADTVKDYNGKEITRLRRVAIETPKGGKIQGSQGQNEAYVSLHGLVFLLADLYMKTPQDLLELVSTHDKEKTRIQPNEM